MDGGHRVIKETKKTPNQLLKQVKQRSAAQSTKKTNKPIKLLDAPIDMEITLKSDAKPE